MTYPGPQEEDLEDERSVRGDQDYPGHPPAQPRHHNPHSQGVYHIPYQQRTNYNNGRDLNRMNNDDDGDKGIRRAPSFADRIREAEANPNASRQGNHQLWSYTDPNARMELRNR